MNRPYIEEFTTHQPRVIYNQVRGSQCLLWDADGNPIPYIHYAPYGELIANQQTIGYDERYKFTVKERDAETGYDFLGRGSTTIVKAFGTLLTLLRISTRNLPRLYIV